MIAYVRRFKKKHEIWRQRIRKSLCRMVKNLFRYLKPLGVDHEYDRQTDGHTETDRQTERPLAIARALTALDRRTLIT